jgi:hypothetical protein
MKWKSWFPVSGGLAKPGSPVTAVRGNTLFVTNSDGGIVTTHLGAGSWTSVSDGRAAPGSPITVVPWGNRFALFIADPNGGIYTAAGDPQGGFGPWASVSEGRATPGSQVTAVPLGDRFAVFITDPNGGIYTTGGTPDAPFGPWASVSEGSAPPGSSIAAVPLTGDLFDLYIADPNGGIYTTRGSPDTGWEPWQYVVPRDPSVPRFTAAPGSPVTALPGNRLVVTDVNGRIAATQGGAFGPGADWLPWVHLGQIIVPLRSPIAAVPIGVNVGGTIMALFVADSSGAVVTAEMPELGVPDFNYEQVSWASLPLVNALPGSRVAAVAIGENNSGETRISLWVTDSDGKIQTTTSL